MKRIIKHISKPTIKINGKHIPLYYIICGIFLLILVSIVATPILNQKTNGFGLEKTTPVPTIQITNQKTYESCMSAAYKNFMNEWNTTCKKQGVNNKLSNCNLPKDISDKLNQSWTTAKNLCYK